MGKTYKDRKDKTRGSERHQGNRKHGHFVPNTEDVVLDEARTQDYDHDFHEAHGEYSRYSA